MTKGLPGSGKTTWAKKYLEENPETVLICKDDLRAMMFNSAWTGNRERIILLARDMIITTALMEGKSVVVHDTNLAPKHEQRLRELVKQHNSVLTPNGSGKLPKSEFIIQDFTDVPIEQCIKQDLLRFNSVGEKVIRNMYKSFLKPKPAVVKRDPSLPNAIICDLDGTLALFEGNPYERDFTKDSLNFPIADILRIYGQFSKTILVSGRKDIFRDQTEQWLLENNISYDKLFMRKTAPAGQQEPKDFVVKKEIYEKHIEGKYNILFVLDDRNQVVDLWRGLGLTCLQVADGDF